MAQLSSRLVISLVDHVTGPAKRVRAALAGMQSAGAMMATGMGMMRRGAASASAASLPLAMIGRSGFEAAYGLEKVLNNIQAVGMLTDEQRGSMKAYIQDLNKSFPFINREIGEAAFELFRAGMTFDQAMGTLKGTLLLAQAGDIERQEAADIATNVLTAMRLPMQTTEQAAASMARVNDVLSYAANKSNTDVRLLGETFKYVAPMAAAAGLSLDDVAAAAMTMANNGIKGSEAGVAMRAALVRMAKPTKDMRATLDRLGVNLGDFITGGRAVGADDIITGLLSSGVDASGQRKAIEAMLADKVLALKPGQLTANLVDLIAKESEGAADKDVLAETIGDILTSSGQNYDLLGFMGALRDKGVGVAEIARIMDVRQGARVLTLLLDDLEAKSREVAARSEGAAQRMADIRMKGIVGEVARLQAAWENLFVAIGDAGVLSTIGGAFDSIAQGLTKLSQISPMALEVGTYALIALTTIGPLGLLMSGFGSAVMMVVGAVGLAAGGVGKLVSLLIRLRSALSGAQAVAAGAGMAGLFGAGAAGAGALGARAASKAMLSGMGASGQMVAGMSAAGAAAAAHGAAKGGGVLGKLAGLGARGMGRLFLPLGLGLMAWDAWTGYEKDGLKGAILNPLTLGMYSADTAEAAPAPGAPGAGGGEVAAAGSEAQTVVANVQSAMNQVRSIVAGVDLTAEGQRIIESLAAGMRAGLPAVQSAASQAAAAASRAALRGAFTDGGK